jgi:hypothetical protein
VLLGSGVRFFEHPTGTPVQLRSIASTTEGETTVLRYVIPSDSRAAIDRAAV